MNFERVGECLCGGRQAVHRSTPPASLRRPPELGAGWRISSRFPWPTAHRLPPASCQRPWRAAAVLAAGSWGLAPRAPAVRCRVCVPTGCQVGDSRRSDRSAECFSSGEMLLVNSVKCDVPSQQGAIVMCMSGRWVVMSQYSVPCLYGRFHRAVRLSNRFGQSVREIND